MSLTLAATVDIAETVRKLADLDKKLRRKALRSTVQKVGTAMLKECKARVPKRLKGFHGYAGGQLKKSIGRKTKSYSAAAVSIVGPRDGFRIQVGVRTKGKRKGEPIYVDPMKYAHLVDRGTRSAAAQPFIDPALRVGINLVDRALQSEVDKVIIEVSNS